MAIVGIDGGGTRTRIAFERNGESSYIERPVSLKVVNGNYLASAQSLVSLFRESIPDSIASLCIGLSGMSQPADQHKLEQAIRSLPEFSNIPIHIEGDASLALKAALGETEDGMLLIAGTG